MFLTYEIYYYEILVQILETELVVFSFVIPSSLECYIFLGEF
jgi:hypothetical protein